MIQFYDSTFFRRNLYRFRNDTLCSLGTGNYRRKDPQIASQQFALSDNDRIEYGIDNHQYHATGIDEHPLQTWRLPTI